MGSGILGAVGQHQSAQAATDAQNAAAVQRYQYGIQQWQNEQANALAIYGQKVNQFKEQVIQNNRAVQRAYLDESIKLNETIDKALFASKGDLVKRIQAQGQIAASGIRGQQAKRFKALNVMAWGEKEAARGASLASAGTAYVRKTTGFQEQADWANKQAHNRVRIPPQPTIPPPPPTMAQGPSKLGLFAGIMGGVASGLSMYNSLQAPSGFGGGQQPLPEGTFDGYASNFFASTPSPIFDGAPRL